MQGWRCNQEDAHIATEIRQSDGNMGVLLCVFDGHGGKEVAAFAHEKFGNILQNLPEFKKLQFKEALIEAFRVFDQEVGTTDFGTDTGTTSNVVYFNQKEIYCSNAGDSRAVLFTNNKAYPLSEDHKPDNEIEKNRIE